MGGCYDVIIIGAGVSGCSVARELSRGRRRIAVLERASDVCEGTSKANSGIVHAGYDAVPGTLKARLNVRGNQLMEELSEKLDFSFRRNGSLVLCFEEAGRERLQELLERGRQNGVEGLKILSREELAAMEPGVSEEAVCALYAPTGGIVCPFGLTIALAENACDNGAEFFFGREVTGIERAEGQYRVETSNGSFTAPVIINAAGVYADVLHNMVSGEPMRIIPRRGEYCLLDKRVGGLVHSTIFQLPTSLGKGILVTPTVHGNLLAGPTAEDISDKEGVNTTAYGLERVLALGGKSVPGLSAKWVITSFAGLRAHGEACGEDFMIGEAGGAPGFFDVAGIESPGLTCAPAIGEYVAALVNEAYPAPVREDFVETRRGIPNMAEASNERRQELIAEDSDYGSVVCRCELVTEGEIKNAIHRTLGARTLDGVKRRVRAGMGRCQSGFCAPRTVEILARELGITRDEVTKAGGGSYLTCGSPSEGADGETESGTKGERQESSCGKGEGA